MITSFTSRTPCIPCQKSIVLIYMQIIAFILINGLAVYLAAYLLPGVAINSVVTALIVGLILGIANAFIKPILVLLTLPITIITLGLFIFVINGLLVLGTSAIVPGFIVENIWRN